MVTESQLEPQNILVALPYIFPNEDFEDFSRQFMSAFPAQEYMKGQMLLNFVLWIAEFRTRKSSQ
jgi:hypothetical protein